MKRLLSALLCLVIALNLIGCSTVHKTKKPYATKISDDVIFYDPPRGESQNNVTKSNKTHSHTVYITRTGTKYHSAGCRYLRQSEMPISIENARKRGFDACSVCGG